MAGEGFETDIGCTDFDYGFRAIGCYRKRGPKIHDMPEEGIKILPK
jgi:hypothetical protein